MKNDPTLEWSFPIPRTHCGVALGNGNFGALVWGRERLRITVNRADFWDHRGGEALIEGTTYERLKAAYDPADGARLNAAFIREKRPEGVNRPSRLPVGRFELALAPGLAPRRAVLDVRTGRLSIAVADGGGQPAGTLLLVLAPDRNLLFIADPDRLVGAVQSRPAREWVGEHLTKYRFTPPTVISGPEGEGWIQDCPADPSLASLCRRVPGGLAICLALGTDAGAAVAAARAEIERLAAEGAPALLERSDAWWRDYWAGMPEVEIPSEFFTRFLEYALFKFAGATNPNSPLPSGLQGPWIEEYQPAPWSGDYHFNVNIQQIYTLAFPTGRFSHLMPLFDMVDRFRPVMRHNARVLFGIEDGLSLAHAVDDRGRACGGISSGASLDPAVSGWTAQLYWLYYQYTLDTDFLRERAFPFMAGVMRVYEEMLEEKEGRLSLPLAISAEYAQPLPGGKRQNAGRDPSNQLACAHMLAEALLQAAETLGVPPRPIWRRIREALPPYTLIGEPGEERIAIWEGQDLDICHRHHGHLAAIYPFDTLGEITPEKQRVIDNTVDHWILKGMGQWSEWCIPWAAILQARLGFTEAPRVLLEMWREVFVNEGLTTVYLPRFRGITAHRRADLVKPKETSEIMQLDGCMAGATALYEMLVHTRGGVTYVFPAVSERWPDVSFRNIHLPGAFRIAGARRGGVTVGVEIESRRGGTIRLAVPGWERATLRRGGREEEVALPAALALAPGETVSLRAR
ncbi:MAG: hypothetical protein HY321_17030 [Armatimonadetes bacterium]|nr:hypothetical protein [Armatimonadota bacterium]